VPFRTVALYRWADHVDDDHVARLEAALAELTAEVPAVRSLTHGADTGATSGSFDHVVVIDVATAEDWRSVRDHPVYILLVEELVTNHVVDQAVAQFRADDGAAMSPEEADVREISDDELMARARRAAQASMDALMAEPDDGGF
jgi:hypothetical protein